LQIPFVKSTGWCNSISNRAALAEKDDKNNERKRERGGILVL